MTTLNQIHSHSPSPAYFAKLLKHLGKTKADDEPLSLLTVLDSNGLDDAIWCLRTEATPERTQRFTLAVARRTEHLHPQAKATLDVVERYLNGTATKAELNAANTAAVDAAVYAAAAAANAAAAAAYTANAADAVNAANAAVYTAQAVYAAVYTADAANAADRVAKRGAEREAQVQIFREIFA